MEDLELLQGTVAAVVYQNAENGYAVLRLNCAGQAVSVVGTIPLPVPGERLMVTGRWTNNANYGKQFEAEFLERLMPETTPEILSYLSSRTVKGIGPKLAARIVERFGAETLAVMEREPQRLAEVTGITPAKAREIGRVFRQQTGMRRLIEFLSLHHLPAELAVRLYRLWGEEAMDLLTSDPYSLTEPGLDADFGLVDRFAISLGIAADDPRRVEAGLVFELSYNQTAGHVFLPEEKLIQATATLLSVDAATVQAGLRRLEEAEHAVQDHLAGIDIAYLPELYEAEQYVARRLGAMAADRLPEPPNLESLVGQAQQAGSVAYSPQQAEAVRAAAVSRLLIVTGGPGTGKTTILRGILELYGRMELTALLAAPTGRAAKRLQEVTGQEACTIHRLLESQPDPATGRLIFTRDEDNPLKAHAVIVDETSMVDISLLASLLRALPPGCRLILVGDPDQLPPVRYASQRRGAGGASHGDFPPGPGEPHCHERPPGQWRHFARLENHHQRFLLPPAARRGGGGCHHWRPVQNPTAGPDGHPAGGNPGSLPHAEGPHRYGQPEPAAAGSAESALSREEGEKMGGFFLP